MLKNYTVFFKANHYNPYKTYAQNANRYMRSKSFLTEAEARAFANEVSGEVYYLGNKI